MRLATIGKTCRTYSSWDINWKDDFENAIKTLASGRDVDIKCPITSSHMKDGRGNICPATVVLPTIAMEAKRRAEKDDKVEFIVDYFMDALSKAICDCKDELLERFDWICSQSPSSAEFMYHNKTFFYYNDEFDKEGIRGVLKHGTLAVGQIGLAECLQILIGKDHTTPEGMELAKQIERLFKDKCKEYKEEWHTARIEKSDVVKEMIIQIEEKENRKLSKDEIDEIVEFCKTKKI